MTLIVKKSFPTALRRFVEGTEIEADDVGSDEYVASLIDAGYLAKKPVPKNTKPPSPVSAPADQET